MNRSGLLGVCGALSLVLLHFALVRCNVIGEWEFQNFHPDLEQARYWKQLDNLTEDDRRRMCLEVYDNHLPSDPIIESYSLDEESNTPVVSAPVLHYSRVRFRHGLVPMPLIACHDKRLTFYLAQGNDTHVFMLRPEKDGTYSFTGSMINVTYPAS